MIILATDPSLTAFGYAVIKAEGSEWDLITVGCIQTKARVKAKRRKVTVDKAGTKVIMPAVPAPYLSSDWECMRLKVIADKLNELCDTHKVEAVIFEDPAGSKSAFASRALAEVKGLVIGFCIGANLPYTPVRAKVVKDKLTSNKNAEKDEIRTVVDCHFPEFEGLVAGKTKVEKEAASDACGVFLSEYLI